jgi:hypothetical protein
MKMTEIFGGKVVAEDSQSLHVEVWPGAVEKIPKDGIVDVIGVAEEEFEGFQWLGKEISVLHTDDAEFKVRVWEAEGE